MEQNSAYALTRRRDAGQLTWRGPALMLPARTVLAVVAQALVAGIFALRGSQSPWRDAEPWLPVYGTLIDAGCLWLLWRLTRREGIRLLDLVGFVPSRLPRDLALGLLLVPLSLVFIFAGVYGAGWLVFGTLTPPFTFGLLPMPAVLYGLLVWPWIWGITEQLTYNGYLAPRLQVLCRSTAWAVAVVALMWAAQHAFMPLTFDGRFMTFRLLSSIPNSVFQVLFFLRIRRLIPFALAHALMDGAGVAIGSLLPLLK